MIRGSRVVLRPIQDSDWGTIEAWARSREGLWGSFQRFQLDHLPTLRQAYEKTRLLSRESGVLLVETVAEGYVVGFVRYTFVGYPDSDVPCPEIGFGIPEMGARRKGFATEAVELLVDYLLAGYPASRVVAFTEVENQPAQRILERLGFQWEGVLRHATFRDGHWRDMAIYGLLREEWKPAPLPLGGTAEARG